MADFSFNECLNATDATLLDGFSGLSEEQDSNSTMGFNQNMTLGRQSMAHSNSTDELQALFPMLHETSLHDMNNAEDITSSSSSSTSSSSLLTSIDVPFEHDLSPILQGNHAPELFRLIDEDALSLNKPTKIVSQSPTTINNEVELKAISYPWESNVVPKPSSTSSYTSSQVLMTVKQEEKYVDAFESDMKTSEPDVAANWNAVEQHAFFSSMKTKWQQSSSTSSTNILNEGYATMGNHQSMLLAMRFQAISTKLKTKTFEEVREFYHFTLDQITKLLAHVEHDVDLTNLDEIRIALWCWFKHLTAKSSGNRNSKSLEDKAQLSRTLLGSIQRSRRQMLKAKAALVTPTSTPSGATNNSSATISTTTGTIFAQATNAKSPNQHQQVYPSTSKIGLSMTPGKMSFMNKSNTSSTPQHQSTKPVSSATVHLPMVRKKRPFASANHQHLRSHGNFHHQESSHKYIHHDPPGGGHKSVVKSLNAMGLFNGDEETPKKQKRLEDHHEMSEMLVSPASSGISSSGKGNMSLINFHTPLSSKKKMSILVRLVPADDTTKAYAIQCGHNPKVEVKMRSTKKISDVVDHMVKKWAVIRRLVPSQAQLRFYPKQDKSQNSPTNTFHAGWGSEDVAVTCFDILKYCGKKSSKNNENIVNLMYQWTDKIPLRHSSTKTVVSEVKKTPSGVSSSSSFGLKTPYGTTSANTILNFTPSSTLSLSPLVLTEDSMVAAPSSSGTMTSMTKSASKRTPTPRKRTKKKKEENVVVTKRATLSEQQPQQQQNQTFMMTTGECMTLPTTDQQVVQEEDHCNPHEDVLSSEWDFEGDAGLDTSFLDDSPEYMWDLVETEEPPQLLQHDVKHVQELEIKSRRRITPMLIAPEESCSL